jgi:ATP-dependent Lon protease
MPSQPPVSPEILAPADAKPTVKRVPVLPVRDTVLFPHAVLPLTVGRESSIQLIESLGEDRSIVVTAQKDPRQDAPTPEDMHEVGTLATVHKIVRMPNQSRFVFTEGVERVRLLRYVQTEPFMVAEVETMDSLQVEPSSSNVEALVRMVIGQFQQIVQTLSDGAHHRRQHRRTGSAGRFCCLVAAHDTEISSSCLETPGIPPRLLNFHLAGNRVRSCRSVVQDQCIAARYLGSR